MLLMGLLKLYVDVQNRRLVTSTRNASVFTLPSFVQGDTMAIELYLLEPNTSGGLSSPLTTLKSISYTVKVGIVTPHPSAPVAHAVLTLTVDPDHANNGKYYGSLPLGSGITSLLGSATSVSSTFEIEVSSAGDVDTPVQVGCTVKAGGITNSTPDTATGDTFPTHAEANNTYVKKTGDAGAGFTLTSPDGTKSVYFWVDNDGVVHNDPIT